MEEKGHSKTDKYGNTDHYDRYGMLKGYSKTDKYGNTDHYDEYGNLKGYSKTDKYGNTDHYDEYGNLTGYSKSDKYGNIDHYNQYGTYEGYSKKDAYGNVDHYGMPKITSVDPYSPDLYAAPVPETKPQPKGEYKSWKVNYLTNVDTKSLDTAVNMSADDIRAFGRCAADMLKKANVKFDASHDLKRKKVTRSGFLCFFSSDVNNSYVYATENFWCLEHTAKNAENVNYDIMEQDEKYYKVLTPDGRFLTGDVVEVWYNTHGNYYRKPYEMTCDRWEPLADSSLTYVPGLIDAVFKRNNIDFSSGAFMRDAVLRDHWLKTQLPEYHPAPKEETKFGYHINTLKFDIKGKIPAYVGAGVLAALVTTMMIYVTGFNAGVLGYLLITALAFGLASIPAVQRYCSSCDFISRIYLAALSLPLCSWMTELSRKNDWRPIVALVTVIFYAIVQYINCRKLSVLDVEKKSVKASLRNIIYRKRIQKIALAIQIVLSFAYAYLKQMGSFNYRWFGYVGLGRYINYDSDIARMLSSYLTLCFMAAITVSAGVALLLSLLTKRSNMKIRLSDNNLSFLFTLIVFGLGFAAYYLRFDVPVIVFSIMWVVFGFIYHRKNTNLYGSVLVLNHFAILVTFIRSLVWGVCVFSAVDITNVPPKFVILIDQIINYVNLFMSPGIRIANKISPLIAYRSDIMTVKESGFRLLRSAMILGSPILPVVIMMCLTLIGAGLREILIRLDVGSKIKEAKIRRAEAEIAE